jgi:hypothetical protein
VLLEPEPISQSTYNRKRKDDINSPTAGENGGFKMSDAPDEMG